MSDSDDDRDQDGINLAGFLFGNINASGQLDNDIFDEDTQRHLGALTKLGLEGQFNDVILEDGATAAPVVRKKTRFLFDDDDTDSEEEEDDLPPLTQSSVPSTSDGADDNDDIYGNEKSPSAVDFSDINELAEEDASSLAKALGSTDTTDYDEDEALMPPPPVPLAKTEKLKSEKTEKSDKEESPEKKLETPLAAMLPTKYVGIDVCEVFPDFRPDKILRFARLFGPGKPGSLPQWWKSVKKRRKKRKVAGTDDWVPEKEEYGFDWRFAEEPDVASLSLDEQEFLRPMEADENASSQNGITDSKPCSSEYPRTWRHGPATLWYDMIGVSPDDETLDYGFKIKAKESPSIEEVHDADDMDTSDSVQDAVEDGFRDEAFHMVTQLNWESNIIWDGNDARLKKLSKNLSAGWVPIGGNRTAQTFNQPGKAGGSANSQSSVAPTKANFGIPGSANTSILSSKAGKGSFGKDDGMGGGPDDTWYSIFPVETGELVRGRWEDEFIWDTDAMDTALKPKVLSIDPNDDNVVLCIPDDVDPNAIQGATPPVKVKIPHPHVKKSKILLGKAGVINVIEEDSPPPSPKNDDKDPYNISNDEYYQPKHTEQSMLKISAAGNIIQHSTPVVELRAPFIPTHMGEVKLRNFHRPPLKRFTKGSLALLGPHPIMGLTKYIKKKAKQREHERLAAGGGDIFFMRSPEDLTGRDGALVLFEYCEEHPPLLNQVGMCSKIKNYYKRKAGTDDGPPELVFGETVFAHTSPFLGAMHPGETIQTVENNMFRAPAYDHPIPKTDFLVIRTRENYFIREFDVLFTVGQECPLYEVPGPNSKRANNFVRDFLQVFIYRLFWKSPDNPRRIKMDDIKKAFPVHSESSIRKRLKQCADFKRTGQDSNWWVIKPEFRLPTEEEIRAMVSPEQCCAYFSLIAAEQRLKDAGYGEKMLFTPQDDDDEDNQNKIEDEVKVAPWNTTRAYIQAMKGKCLLQLSGPADPTGCGEGFSYVRVPNKPQTNKEEQQKDPKRIVTGTDADLRRLSLNNAKALLRKFGVPEEEIKKLSRWEVIDVVRTLSTEKAKAGEQGMTKFSRGNRFSVAEHQERYKEECQRIFELQNRVLASNEVLSTDEESSEEESSDIEEMGKNIENMLSNKKTSSQLTFEKEEQERRELQQMILGETKKEEEKPAKKSKRKEDEDTVDSSITGPTEGRILKIHRTFRSNDGREYTRTEIVRKSAVIDMYVKIRTSSSEQAIRQLAMKDDQHKEELKKQKRRMQEQLRRLKRNMAKESQKEKEPKKKKIRIKPDLKMKCGACGQVGHMKTNKACPNYSKADSPSQSSNAAMPEDEIDDMEAEVTVEDDSMVCKVEGTKMQISGIKQNPLLMKFPKDAAGRSRRKRQDTAAPDYLKRDKTTNRRRVDPQVSMCTIFEAIVKEMNTVKEIAPFLYPVNTHKMSVGPSYFEKVKHPMDLQTIREKIRDKKYELSSDFNEDVKLIASNSTAYNGEEAIMTKAAWKMHDICKRRLDENAEALEKLEKQINPLLGDDDQKSLNYILKNVLDKLKTMKEASPFLKPVNKHTVPDYYQKIKKPIDFETMNKKINKDMYHSRGDFLSDMSLLQRNAEQYNGENSQFNRSAQALLEKAPKLLDTYNDKLSEIEGNLADSKPQNSNFYEEFEEEDSTMGRMDETNSPFGMQVDDSNSFFSYSGKQEMSNAEVEEGEYLSDGDDSNDQASQKRGETERRDRSGRGTDFMENTDNRQVAEAMVQLSGNMGDSQSQEQSYGGGSSYFDTGNNDYDSEEDGLYF